MGNNYESNFYYEHHSDDLNSDNIQKHISIMNI